MPDHPESYEDVTVYGLDEEDEHALLLAHNECTFIWSTKDGWPVGVIMSYVFRDGKFWLTASEQRLRIAAIRRDPRVSVVVTSTGSPLPRNKTVTWKGTATVHRANDPGNESLKAWFYGELATAVLGQSGGRAHFVEFLDSPRRVIIEVEPVKRIGYDGVKMGKATAAWIAERRSEPTKGTSR